MSHSLVIAVTMKIKLPLDFIFFNIVQKNNSILILHTGNGMIAQISQTRYFAQSIGQHKYFIRFCKIIPGNINIRLISCSAADTKNNDQRTYEKNTCITPAFHIAMIQNIFLTR